MDKSTSSTGASSEASTAPTNKKPQKQIQQHSQSRAPESSVSSSATTAQSSASNSVSASPLPSREASPIRVSMRSASTKSIIAGGSRSRKNSQDSSPARTPRSSVPVPSSSHPSRSLASTTTPVLLPAQQSQTAQDPALKAPTPQQVALGPDQSKDGCHRWPVSPRLRSPPPNVNKPTAAPSISVQRATPTSQPPESLQAAYESEPDEPSKQSGMRTPARGGPTPLETVQEISLPNSPGPTADEALEKVREKLSTEADGSTGVDPKVLKARANLVAGTESGSESGSTRGDRTRKMSTGPSPPLLSRQSSSLSTKQHKAGKQEPLSQTMTVETEVVEVPTQSTISGNQGGNGTLKTIKAKPSTETIRPKKEKKKPARKPAPVNPSIGEHPRVPSISLSAAGHHNPRSVSGHGEYKLSSISIPQGQGPMFGDPTSPRKPLFPASFYGKERPSDHQPASVKPLLTKPRAASSKSDNFEAKIASAVDEANTSDSEETFVYDSNPPDGPDRRRFHSRTPSATSLVSQPDRSNLRSIYSVLEGTGTAVAAKRQNKFLNSNTYNSNGGDSVGADDDSKSTGGRSAGSAARGSARALPHFGRWGRHPNNHHTSVLDHESPFHLAPRTKSVNHPVRELSGPPSPRNNNGTSRFSHSKRSNMQMASSYDLDETAGADDERTPLVGSVRLARTNRNRRNQQSMRHMEANTYGNGPSLVSRFAACLVMALMLVLVVTGAIGFMFATSQPMTDIELVAISNVLASEPELMFDLTLKAHNPNIVVVTVDQADLEVFAKSIRAGSDSDWVRYPNGPPKDYFEVPGLPGVHVSDDPPDDPPDRGSAPNMRLGSIMDFDSPLSFEGSFFHNGVSKSTGEMRLPLPGNGTAGGSARWERIINDEFVLIVKGVVKYSLPLSTHVRSASVSGRVTVESNSANDPVRPPNSTYT